MSYKPIDFVTTQNSKSGSKLTFSNYLFIKYLEEELHISKVKVGISFQLVEVNNYKVSKISTSQIKSLVLRIAKEVQTDINIIDFILGKTNVFSPNYLDAVKTIDIAMHRDNSNSSYLYFKNGVVQISANSISSPIPYQQFKKYVWEDHIIERDFDENMYWGDGMFTDFISKLGNNDEKRINRLCTTIGYCLHDYKTSATSKAVVISDQEVSHNPEGGSGKSLIHNALSKLRKSVIQDGKSLNPKSTFAWQKLDETIRLVVIDDARKGFDFEEIFSLVTSGFTNINRKNKDEIELSVEDSPKIIITTNNVLRGGGGSFSRRQVQIELFQYFSKSWTPIDEYKTTFFSGWNSVEWSKFDRFMAECIKMYLVNGIVECPEVDWRKKDLIRKTNNSFAEWILGEKDSPNDVLESLKNYETSTILRDRFINDSGLKIKISNKLFVGYLKAFSELFDYKLESIKPGNDRKHRLVK